MAKKSKTQRAKASAARAAKRVQAQETDVAQPEEVAPEEGGGIKKRFRKTQETVAATDTKPVKKEEKKAEKKVKRLGFLSEVRSELKRVTWPSRQDVFRWSLVVVAALLFFGIFVTILDNLIVGPILYFISGLGA